MFLGALLVDFSQSCVKTVARVYTENESWHDPACPDVPVLVFQRVCFLCLVPSTALLLPLAGGHRSLVIPV